MKELSLKFIPDKYSRDASSEYEAIWKNHGEAITQALQYFADMPFWRKRIIVYVHDGRVPESVGVNEIHLPANIVPGSRVGIITRVLGEQLLKDNNVFYHPSNRLKVVNLFLYCTLVKALGKFYADEHVRLESMFPGTNVYNVVWKWYFQTLTNELRVLYLEKLWTHSRTTRRANFIDTPSFLEAGE